MAHIPTATIYSQERSTAAATAPAKQPPLKKAFRPPRGVSALGRPSQAWRCVALRTPRPACAQVIWETRGSTYLAWLAIAWNMARARRMWGPHVMAACSGRMWWPRVRAACCCRVRGPQPLCDAAVRISRSGSALLSACNPRSPTGGGVLACGRQSIASLSAPARRHRHLKF